MNRLDPKADAWTKLLRATERLLEARADQMVTEEEWSRIRDAVVSCGGSLPKDDDESGAD